jgi:hypothetical protein
LIFKSTPHIFIFIFIFCIFQKFYFFFTFQSCYENSKSSYFFTFSSYWMFGCKIISTKETTSLKTLLSFFPSLSLKNFWAQMQQFVLQCAIKKWEQLTLLASTSFLILIKTLNMKKNISL